MAWGEHGARTCRRGAEVRRAKLARYAGLRFSATCVDLCAPLHHLRKGSEIGFDGIVANVAHEVLRCGCGRALKGAVASHQKLGLPVWPCFQITQQ